MSDHPLNLFLRFCLELAGLFAVGYWGWRSNDTFLRYILAFGLPLIFAILWGIFNVPNDPSRSGMAPVPVPGTLRLFLELGLFALGAMALFSAGRPIWSAILGGLVTLHYIISYDRIIWLIKQ
jgi:hypothetical protein